MARIKHISVSFHLILFFSISKTLYLGVEQTPRWTTAQRFTDVLRSCVFIRRGADDKHNLYLGEFSSISYDLYLRKFAFRCRINVYVADSPPFHGCLAILCFYE